MLGIVCERCSAAFTVDPQLIPEGGARTACPSCGHPVVVHRAGTTPVPLPAARPPPGYSPTPLPPSAGATPYPYPAPEATPSPYQTPYASPYAPPPGTPLPALPSFPPGFTPQPAPAPTDPYAPPLPPDPLERDGYVSGRYAALDANEAALISARRALRTTHPDARAAAGLDPAGRSSRGAPGLGTAWGADPFEDSGPHPSEDSRPQPPPDATDGEWRVRKIDGSIEGPYEAQDLLARCEAGLVLSTDLVAHGADPFQPLAAYSLTASFARAPAPAHRFRAYASTEAGPLPWKGLAAALVLLVGIGVGAVVFTVRPTALFGKPPPAEDLPAHALLDSWQDTEPAPIASAGELYQLAQGFYATDTRESFRRAAEAYKRVLLRDPRHLRAMAGYAEVRGVLAVEEGDEVGLRESAELLSYALRHGSGMPEPHVARANLQAAAGTHAELLIAQQEAEKARRLAPNNPQVLLAMGRAHLPSNPEFALEFLQRAAELDPSAVRAPLLLGRALARLGRLAEARSAFEKRRRFVPDDPQADLELAELDASIGRFDRARRQLALAARRSPHSPDVRILSAVLAYQVDDDLRTARRELDQILATRMGRRHRVRASAHAAAVAHELGDLATAEALARKALELDSESGPLHYRLAVLRLGLGRGEEAREHVKKALPHLGDEAQRAMLQARLAASLGEVDQARTHLARAALVAPWRAEPRLLEASLYAQIGARTQALAVVRKALEADPGWTRSHRALTEFYEGQQYLTQVVGAFEGLLAARQETALVNGALAMARYHTGDRAGAELAARQALGGGESVLAARLYLAQLALDRKRPREALGELATLGPLHRTTPTAPYLAGRAFTLLGRFDDAHARFREALELDPQYLPAKVGDAEVLAALGEREQALALFRSAFRSDPDDVHVRRGLDALERAGASGHTDFADLAIEVEMEP